MELLLCYIKCSVMKLFIAALGEYSIRIIQEIMPCSMHIEVTVCCMGACGHLPDTARI